MEGRLGSLGDRVTALGRWFTDAFVPERCVVCGAEGVALCPACSAGITVRPERRILRDGSAVVSFFPYGAPAVRAIIGAYKFRDRTALGGTLRSLLARGVAAAPTTLPDAPVTLVPVPLTAGRERERGFNQAEILAELLLPHLPAGSTVRTDGLRRSRETAQQAATARAERERNVQGAFVATFHALADERFVIVDDVVTSGETMAACAAALRAAGAAAVSGCAFAHAPAE